MDRKRGGRGAVRTALEAVERVIDDIVFDAQMKGTARAGGVLAGMVWCRSLLWMFSRGGDFELNIAV
jgi:hypothetical protein